MKWIWDRHAKWAAQLDAYADSALRPAEHASFEAHLAGCDRCSAALADTLALKTAFAAAPAIEAPRSFRLTPDMAAGRARASGSSRVPAAQGRAAGAGAAVMAMPMRLAGSTALVAAIALAAVVSFDLARTGDQAGTFSATDMRTTSAPETTGDSLVPMAGDGPDTVAKGDEQREDGTAAGAGDAPPAAELARAGRDDGGDSPAWLIAQAALAIVLAGSLGVMAVIWTRNRRAAA
jgi:anti-sigma factor RsiW